MSDWTLEDNREYYEHEVDCSQTNWEDTTNRGVRTCKDCGGIFWVATGKGVGVTAKVQDENYTPPTGEA